MKNQGVNGWVAFFKNSFREVGKNTKQALTDKGDLIDLPRRHRPKYSIIVLAVLLSILGFIMVFSAAPGLFTNIYTNDATSCQIFGFLPSENIIDCKMTEFLITQSVYLVAGIVALMVSAKLSINFWRKVVLPILIVAFGASIILFVAHLAGWSMAVESGGAVRWLKLGPISFQPAEFMKFAIMLFAASFLATAHQKGLLNSIRKTLLPLLVVVIAGLFLVVVLQSDLSSGIVIFAIVVAQMIISNMRWRNIISVLALFISAGVVAVILFPYRLGRIMDFFSTQCIPGQDLEQICSALMSMGSGGLLGRGLGQSLSVFWVPQVMDDAVFSLVGETFGFFGAVAVLIIFGALIFRIINLANYLPNMYLRLLTAGAFGWIATQTVINIGAFTNSIPLTGITLPFISSGGSSLLCVMATMGVVFGVSRYTSHSKVITKKGADNEDFVRRWGLGRTRYASGGDYLGDPKAGS
ncbi:MAG: FtsW/RodA/SpoVE family cell cycle protein [Candidatus Nomurabacteria bacterium]|jgi:cell division protein FtsW|nr:FtsW/RodA/SpoVE family cell cycle protein [Candidatus Nomurabacteria bacterium]